MPIKHIWSDLLKISTAVHLHTAVMKLLNCCLVICQILFCRICGLLNSPDLNPVDCWMLEVGCRRSCRSVFIRWIETAAVSIL